MRLKKIEIIKFKNFNNIVIDFEKNSFSDIYSIASKNGGGKSSLIQFIFIMLHCFMDIDRKIYIQNILDEFYEINDDFKLVKFTVEEDSEEYSLEFFITQDRKPRLDYQLYLDLDSIEKKLKKLPELKTLDSYIKENEDENIDFELKLKKEINLLKVLYQEKKDSINILEKKLKKENICYITHLKTNQNILLLKTKMPLELLKKLTNRVYLSAPSTQIFLFLPQKTREKIFNMYSYCNSIGAAKEHLDGFYTYDFASTELILEAFKKATDKDVEIKRVTGEYGTKYDELSSSLKKFLDGKYITLNRDANRVIFKLNESDKELSPEDLSHGELKKLGIYIWLKNIVKENSIVLIDELDIALHPKWQYKIVKDLAKWSSNSQFLLATHSPQILSSTYYKNIIKLDNAEVKRYNKPPLDRDINAIIVEIMEAPDFPEDLLELHKKYRKLINDGKVDTDEAKKLKEEILEYESESSSFFQEINFDLELM